MPGPRHRGTGQRRPPRRAATGAGRTDDSSGCPSFSWRDSTIADGTQVVRGVERRLVARAVALHDPLHVLARARGVHVEHVAALGQVVLREGGHVAGARLVYGNEVSLAHLPQLALRVVVVGE